MTIGMMVVVLGIGCNFTINYEIFVNFTIDRFGNNRLKCFKQYSEN